MTYAMGATRAARLWLSWWFLAACACEFALAERVPVVLWGYAGEAGAPPSLASLSEGEFVELMSSALADGARVVAFVEPTLSAEDLGGEAFARLGERFGRPSSRGLYLPRVENAAEALAGLLERAAPDGVDRVDVADDGLSADVAPGEGRFLVVDLRDARDGEDRDKMLYRHDRFIDEMYEKLSEKRPRLLAVYTGRRPSFEVSTEGDRHRRHLLQAKDNEVVLKNYNASGKAYLYIEELIYRDGGLAQNFTNGDFALKNSSEEEIATTMDFTSIDYKIDLLFKNINGYWMLDSAMVKNATHEVLLKGDDVGAPDGFSYHCGQNTIMIANNKSKDETIAALEFRKLQVQPFFKKEAKGMFGAPYDCVGVMTIPIWSGIFVVLLLTIIMAAGIAMMMDIRTMDRFDDPKGKTITINAGE